MSTYRIDIREPPRPRPLRSSHFFVFRREPAGIVRHYYWAQQRRVGAVCAPGRRVCGRACGLSASARRGRGQGTNVPVIGTGLVLVWPLAPGAAEWGPCEVWCCHAVCHGRPYLCTDATHQSGKAGPHSSPPSVGGAVEIRALDILPHYTAIYTILPLRSKRASLKFNTDSTSHQEGDNNTGENGSWGDQWDGRPNGQSPTTIPFQTFRWPPRHRYCTYHTAETPHSETCLETHSSIARRCSTINATTFGRRRPGRSPTTASSDKVYNTQP